MLGEFDIIARYFATPDQSLPISGITLGPGDDCALLSPAAGTELAMSVDTSVADVHFPGDAPPEAIGHRALAVALSDLAAMGARPRGCLMALTLTHGDPAWLERFAQGFLELGQRMSTPLIGGDVTRGTLSIAVTVIGDVPVGQALRRSGAMPGERLAVTGALGGGHGGLRMWQAGGHDLEDPLLAAYLTPTPQLEAGRALRGLASAALDISDGLLADLGHLCHASGVGASLDPACIPLAPTLEMTLGSEGALHAALNGGDDYQLLISVPDTAWEEAQRRCADCNVTLTEIGHVVAEPGIRGIPETFKGAGWQHFTGGGP
ncbi:thiamine-phosphate kinase [Chromohalobacter beijerinckii]|uniref:Thiamine-monophosphate kinase n=2 Tax=Chromohalobacter TaxID=42054 RepID=A0ABZ0YCH5_9GAMM|nr:MULTISPECIES: thiamine-phosphate kinase [Chromohalobacter]MCK0765320.1 thiamine-phosphate kinase [Chromohalobacter beijerinckii]MCK0767655.1 thiamine-phosphate kinase [Chromohalobacter canadensis]WQH09750.1 thiamine-phosphate kinase [Chromohalobacter canadensis]